MQEGWDDEDIYTVPIPCLRHYDPGCGVGPARAGRQHRMGVSRLIQPHSDLHGRTYWVSGKKVYLAFPIPVSSLIIANRTAVSYLVLKGMLVALASSKMPMVSCGCELQLLRKRMSCDLG